MKVKPPYGKMLKVKSGPRSGGFRVTGVKINRNGRPQLLWESAPKQRNPKKGKPKKARHPKKKRNAGAWTAVAFGDGKHEARGLLKASRSAVRGTGTKYRIGKAVKVRGRTRYPIERKFR